MIVDRTGTCLVVCLFLLSSFAASQPPQTKPAAKPTVKPAAKPPETPLSSFKHFTAVMNGGVVGDVNRKIYRSGDLLRLDFRVPMEFFKIVDLRSAGTWSVDPNRCSYGALPDAGAYLFVAVRDYLMERSMSADTETIDGHTCKIENATFTPKDGRPAIKMKFWEAQDLDGFPVRIDLDRPERPIVTYHFTEVSLDTPDAKLFEHPAKCGAVPKPGDKDVQTKPLTMPSANPPEPPKPPYAPPPQ